MNNYDIVEQIGEGAHGVVFKAQHRQSGDIVALKKVSFKRMEKEMLSLIREIKALQEMEKSENVIELLNFFAYDHGFVLVFEFMLSDLSEIIRNYQIPLNECHIKSYMKMILNGVKFCHQHNIIHRDLKPANLLISECGKLKLADFGLARVFSEDPNRPYSHQVATRWYRAPELLYGSHHYTMSVDLWAIGCIFAELINRSPLFPADSDIQQLCYVVTALGTPNETNWPECVNLPDYGKISFPPTNGISMKNLIPDANELAINLLEKFIIYQSDRRISANDALNHSFFFNDPLPSHYSDLPIPCKSKKNFLYEFDTGKMLEDLIVPLDQIRPHSQSFFNSD
ncbi:hypothetical protein SNEBB_009511 [Seison nebaliae]|nr:hypothetical protein SNEBB_009511 [Seison nebaliae]